MYVIFDHIVKFILHCSPLEANHEALTVVTAITGSPVGVQKYR